jgi:serine/threonine protein kinase
VKVLPPHLADNQVFQQRFRREAKSAASLNQPHVVPIHDFGEIEGRLFVAMQLIDGHDLQALPEDGPLEPARAVGIIEQIDPQWLKSALQHLTSIRVALGDPRARLWLMLTGADGSLAPHCNPPDTDTVCGRPRAEG